MTHQAVAVGQVGQSEARSWPATPGRLLRFLAVLAVACGVACLYFYQVSTITGIRAEAIDLRDKAAALERENTALMLQVAAWNTPQHIQAEAAAKGLVAAAPQAVSYLEVATGALALETNNGTKKPAASWQVWLAEIRDRLLALTATARNVARAGK